LVLLGVLFSIEAVSSEGVCVGVGLMFFFAVQAFKYVRAEFTMFGFKTWNVSLEVGFIIPSKVTIVFDLV